MRWFALAAAAILLSGCGLPPIVSYISYGADVISYLATKKSVTDHGISLVMQKDCALLRVLDGRICIEKVEEVALSDCAHLETSHDTAGTRDGSGKGNAFMRRPNEAYHITRCRAMPASSQPRPGWRCRWSRPGSRARRHLQ